MGDVPGSTSRIDHNCDIPIACSLDPADLAGRTDEVRALLTTELIGRDRTPDGLRLRFPATPGTEDRLRDLMAREKACCPFFDFALERRERELILEVMAPEASRPFVEDLFATTPPHIDSADSSLHRPLPLEGKKILVTRPREQAAELVHALRVHGAEPVLLPAIEIRPLEDATELDRVLARVLSYDWVIFTSANGVKHVWERLTALGIEDVLEDGETGRTTMQPRVAAIGPGTAAALERRGARPDYVPREFVAEALADGLPHVPGARILMLRADIARPVLREHLEARGAQVDDVAAYRTVPGAAVAGAKALAGVDAVTFTSSSTVRGFLSGVGLVPADVVVACIGPITAQTARELGVRVDAVAETYTIPGLVEALVRHFGGGDSRDRRPRNERETKRKKELP